MLYFVGTPIGNLKDISYRAIETLESVDVIACEDTRKSLILLNHYNIKKHLITYNKVNEMISSDGIVKLLKEGKNVAVISDSGMPVISDPGNILCKKLKENNLEYTVVCGPNACLSALILSGFDASGFTFLGFLPEKNSDKEKLLESAKKYQTTLVFYVSPHNVFKDIELFNDKLGNRKACLVKEISKVFESALHFELGNPPDIEPKGEYVLVIEGAEEVKDLQNLSIDEQIDFFLQTGLTKKEAIKKVGKINKIPNLMKDYSNK